MIKDGLTHLSFELGLMAAQTLLENKVADICGPSYQRLPMCQDALRLHSGAINP
jgi:hypothetical protein